MELYNTLTREKEIIKPLTEGKISMYTCGPTVYGFAHIGNLRAYLFMDWLRRSLKMDGYSLHTVMNITDVGHLVSDGDEGEDKMEKGARERGKTPWEIAAEYTDAFMRDIAALNITVPETVVKATDHIQEMIDYVTALQDKGFAYETGDGIYFDIAKFPEYGKLSRLNLEEQQAGARVEVNTEKRHPADFALWKKAPPEHIMQWPSPWGMGYPGWHIECSALGLKYLGERFDVHTGGVDHIPVHHENEIAQNEALLGHPMVNCWMHGEFMLVNNGKMGKSLGNCYRLTELAERGYSPMHFRFFCANAHYRNKLNFTWDGMEAAKTSYNRLLAALQVHKNGGDIIEAERLDELRGEFRDAILDDINIPKALGVLWTLARLPEKCPAAYELAREMDAVLGLRLDEPLAEETEAPDAEIEALIAQRQAARKNKDFAEADRVRDELKNRGITLEDTREGVKWKRV